MFFIMGITDGKKMFDFHQLITCEVCGAYGRYQVLMTYTVLSLFFIPCLKWNKRYFVQTSCCKSLYALDSEIGKRIAHGEEVEILPRHLTGVQLNRRCHHAVKRCETCGYQTEEDFEFCPKCGRRF